MDTITELAALERSLLAQLPVLAKMHIECPADLRAEMDDILKSYLVTAGLVGEVVIKHEAGV